MHSKLMPGLGTAPTRPQQCRAVQGLHTQNCCQLSSDMCSRKAAILQNAGNDGKGESVDPVEKRVAASRSGGGGCAEPMMKSRLQRESATGKHKTRARQAPLRAIVDEAASAVCLGQRRRLLRPPGRWVEPAGRRGLPGWISGRTGRPQRPACGAGRWAAPLPPEGRLPPRRPT